jgi:hypothetical protein
MRSNTTPGIAFKTLVLPVEMKGNLVHAFLLAGPVSLKKTVRINATTIP